MIESKIVTFPPEWLESYRAGSGIGRWRANYIFGLTSHGTLEYQAFTTQDYSEVSNDGFLTGFGSQRGYLKLVNKYVMFGEARTGETLKSIGDIFLHTRIKLHHRLSWIDDYASYYYCYQSGYDEFPFPEILEAMGLTWEQERPGYFQINPECTNEPNEPPLDEPGPAMV